MKPQNAIYRYAIQVTEMSIDRLQHVNNREYLRWMEEAAIAHARECGMSIEALEQKNRIWVVRQHWVEYLRSAFLGDVLTMYTWVESIHRYYSLRRYALKRENDILMLGATEWVYMDLMRMRPVVLTRSEASLFSCVLKDSRLLRDLGIPRGVRFRPMGALRGRRHA